MDRPDESVAILGGGIAGLAAAITLRRQGRQVSVYERHDAPTGQGAGLMCWPNACFVLDRLGVLASARARGGAPTAMRRTDARGNEIGVIDIARLNAAAGQTSIALLRRDLQELLLDRALELGAEVHFGHAAVEIRASSRATDVHFANGASVRRDLVIGADGRMGSVARAFVAGQNEPRYQGFVNWVGIYHAEAPQFEDMSIRDHWGVGLRFGIVPVSPTTAYWAAAASQPDIIRSEPATRHRELEQLFAGWPPPIGEILSGPSARDTHEIHVHDHDPLEVWHRGNVILIGDAAHASLPTSGQGACQALEDAWLLAEILNDPRSASVYDTFTRFTRQRFDKTRDITVAGRRLAASLFDPDPAASRRRDAEARALDPDQLALGMARLWTRGLPMASS